MKTVTVDPSALAPDLRSLKPERIQALAQYLTVEIEDALTARHPTEVEWTTALRQYAGTPKNPTRNLPIESAPNFVVPLGAIGTDAIYAQIIDLVWNVSPPVTVRATNKLYVPHAKAFQRWSEFVATNELQLRNANEHATLDDVLLGTGVYYVPWIEEIKRTDISEILYAGPRAYAVPPEDVVVPGGSAASPQDVRLLALRFWYNKSELELYANNPSTQWDISGFACAGNVSSIRYERERLAKTSDSGKRLGDLYEVMIVAASYDINLDGINEDLLVVWDRTSRRIAKLEYYPYDRRPIEKMCYQIRAHNFYGQGVPAMLWPLEDAATETLCFWMANMFLANCRMWKGLPDAVELPFIAHPNKFIGTADPSAFDGVQMSDVYNSGPQALSILLGLAERRTGQNDMTMPRPSQVLGSRTPATTSMMMFQQVSRRFTPAFDQVRMATAGCVKQAMYRYQERLLANDTRVAEHINTVMGSEDGALVIQVLKDRNFDQSIAIEMTASSANVNREVDRQNAMFLVQMLAQYYDKVVQLMAIVANPQLPQPVRDVAKKIADAAGEIIERTVRTFDSIRDPAAFIINVESEIDQLSMDAQMQQAIPMLLAQMGGATNGGAAPGAETAPPQEEAPQ